VAVVSVGEGNQSGHPVDAAVERCAQAGVRFLRTDRDGAVTALTDGHGLVVHTFAEERRRYAYVVAKPRTTKILIFTAESQRGSWKNAKS
jgi:competence protein ComEC